MTSKKALREVLFIIVMFCYAKDGRSDDRVATLALSDPVHASLLAFPTQRASSETPFFSTRKASCGSPTSVGEF
jgi:hypothetical protein